MLWGTGANATGRASRVYVTHELFFLGKGGGHIFDGFFLLLFGLESWIMIGVVVIVIDSDRV